MRVGTRQPASHSPVRRQGTAPNAVCRSAWRSPLRRIAGRVRVRRMPSNFQRRRRCKGLAKEPPSIRIRAPLHLAVSSEIEKADERRGPTRLYERRAAGSLKRSWVEPSPCRFLSFLSLGSLVHETRSGQRNAPLGVISGGRNRAGRVPLCSTGGASPGNSGHRSRLRSRSSFAM